MVVEAIPESEAPGTSIPTGVKGSDDPPHKAKAGKKK